MISRNAVGGKGKLMQQITWVSLVNIPGLGSQHLAKIQPIRRSHYVLDMKNLNG